MEVNGQHHAPAKTPVPTEWGDWWSPELVWTLWIREKSHAPSVISSLDHPACSYISILTTLSAKCRTKSHIRVDDKSFENVTYFKRGNYMKKSNFYA
jgi:hypothetical protein